MAAELLETLPSIPADVEAPDEPDADDAATDEGHCAGAYTKAVVYNRAALP